MHLHKSPEAEFVWTPTNALLPYRSRILAGRSVPYFIEGLNTILAFYYAYVTVLNWLVIEQFYC